MTNDPTNDPTIEVLFLCQHSAGKSVFAATYFRAAAARLGLAATAEVAGAEPDDEVMPGVRAALEGQGLAVVDHPRLVAAEHTDAADIVVSVGCDRERIPAHTVTEWDVPMLSDDFAGSMNEIHALAESLARDLAARATSAGRA